MATYKKRGYKSKTKVEKEIELEDGSATAEVFKSLDEGASKTEAWAEKNQKYIIGFVSIAAICLIGYLLYQKYVQEPNQIEAANEAYQAQAYFDRALNSSTEQDSLYNLALNGSAGKYGLIEIADKYSSTPAGNLANYQAGIAYLNLNKYQEAINYLDKFDGSDENLAPLAKGAIGDAFNQLGQKDQALKYYEEAATMRTNDLTTPRFLLKAGITALGLSKPDVALKHFKTISESYAESPEAKKAEVYKGQAEAMK